MELLTAEHIAKAFAFHIKEKEALTFIHLESLDFTRIFKYN
jgi:hypothetical protein